jgi:hypothetical protein
MWVSFKDNRIECRRFGQTVEIGLCTGCKYQVGYQPVRSRMDCQFPDKGVEPSLKNRIYEDIVRKKLDKFPESLRYLLTDLYDYNYKYWIEKMSDTIGSEFVRENGFTRNQLNFIDALSSDLNDVLDRYENLLSLVVEVRTENTLEFMKYLSECTAEHLKFFERETQKRQTEKD